MTNNEIEDILIKKWASDKLAHFYIFRIPPHKNSKNNLLGLTKSFLAKIAAKEKALSNEQGLEVVNSGHPDLQVLSEVDNTKAYTLSDEIITDFIKFNQYSCFELKQRFIVLDDAHRVNELISNKLLKTLEEPTDNTTIIFLEHTGKKLLTTIESRALSINWRGENQKEDSNLSFLEFLASQGSDFEKISKEHLSSPFKISEFFKAHKHLENDFINATIQFLLIQNQDFSELIELEELTKWNVLSQTFHNPQYQRLASIQKYIAKHL